VDHDALLARFRDNTRPWQGRVRVLEGESRRILRALPPNPAFHGIYIDGSHQAPDVLEDAILAWPLLRPEGVMVFDDYGWHEMESRPGPAIDAFLGVFSGRYELLDKGYQVTVRRV
jgi:hypothetical protein